MKKIFLKKSKYHDLYKALIYKSMRFINIYIFRDKFFLAHRKWVNDKGDQNLRYNYKLNSESIVFDLGGYEGEFAQKIFDKYNSNIYVFEPVKKFYNIILEKFRNNKKIKTYQFGLSDKDDKMNININKNATSIYLDNGEKEKITLKSIINFMNNNNINSIDLLKINIEGGEFPLLFELIKNNKIKNIKNLQIQFHNFVPNAKILREEIRSVLNQTHHLTYDYYFIWENWQLNETI